MESIDSKPPSVNLYSRDRLKSVRCEARFPLKFCVGVLNVSWSKILTGPTKQMMLFKRSLRDVNKINNNKENSNENTTFKSAISAWVD